MRDIRKEYELAKKEYAKIGVDTDKAIETLSSIRISHPEAFKREKLVNITPFAFEIILTFKILSPLESCSHFNFFKVDGKYNSKYPSLK